MMFIKKYLADQKTVHVAVSIVVLILSSCTGYALAGIRCSEIHTLEAPITVGDVKARFEKHTQGHGPYIWYKCDDQLDKEAWFWLSMSNGTTTFNEIKINFVSLVNSANPDDMEMLWPTELRHKKVPEVFDSFYPNYSK